MGFFDKLFKKKEEKKEEPAAKPKAEPTSTSASFKAEPAPAKTEAPKAAAPKSDGANPGPYDFIVPPVATAEDASVPKDAILPAADLGPLLHPPAERSSWRSTGPPPAVDATCPCWTPTRGC